MATRRHLHRTVALLASAGATAALTLVPNAGAYAAVQGLYIAGGNAGADFVGSGGGTCDVTSGSDSVQTGIRSFDHGTKRASADLRATFTNSLDPSDKVTVKGHVDSSLTLKKKHNDLSTFALTVGGTIAVNHTVTGSQCRGSGQVFGATQVAFTEHKKGWLYLTRDTKKPNSFVEFILINTRTGQAVALDFFQGSRSHVTTRARLKPGTYEVSQNEAGLAIGAGGILMKSQALSARAAQTVHLTAQFKPNKH
jgi:hypothetical protein